MSAILIKVSAEQHDKLVSHLDGLPAVGDMIGKATPAELDMRLADVATFLTDTLLPHLATTEHNLYPELERMLQNRHSMTPMRREHQEITRYVDEIVRLQRRIARGSVDTGDAVALRRVIFRLYALLKVHLAEEQLYLGIVEHGISPESADLLASALQHAVVHEA
jgi:hemerythrin-like domain-containing protein